MLTILNLESATIQITSGYQSGEDVEQPIRNYWKLGQFDWNIVVIWYSNRSMRLLWNQLRIPIHLIRRTQQTVR